MATFRCNDGRTVDLDWQDGIMIVSTTGAIKERVGSISFSHREDHLSEEANDYYLVINMHLDGPYGCRAYLHQGIGREIIRIVGQEMPVVFTRHDGQTRGDGSHLTGDGPIFAGKMVEQGLAYWDGPEVD